MARKLALAHGLADDEVVVSRTRLDELQSLLYCLESAIEDVKRDVAAAENEGEIRDALSWLVENAEPLSKVWIEPRTTD